MSHTLDITGAAELMKVHPQTVHSMIKSGELPAAKVGRAYVMLTKDVLAHIENAIIQQTAHRMRRPAKLPKPRSQVAAPKVCVSHHHAV